MQAKRVSCNLVPFHLLSSELSEEEEDDEDDEDDEERERGEGGEERNGRKRRRRHRRQVQLFDCGRSASSLRISEYLCGTYVLLFSMRRLRASKGQALLRRGHLLDSDIDGIYSGTGTLRIQVNISAMADYFLG